VDSAVGPEGQRIVVCRGVGVSMTVGRRCRLEPDGSSTFKPKKEDG
jgi:hypothetical protein